MKRIKKKAAKKVTKKKSSKPKTFNLKSFVIATLRRASYRYAPRNEAKTNARIMRGLYLCAGCGEAFGQKDIKVDHIKPVVDVTTGWVSWDNYIERMFCPVEGFQILCCGCHDLKSSVERELRVQFRKVRKNASED